MRILILGSRGFLGSRFLFFQEHYLNLGIKLEACSLKFDHKVDVDKYDFSSYDAIINCAAMTNLKDCELNPEKAFWANSGMPERIAETIKNTGTKFVFVSSDAVFNGSSTLPTEMDEPDPISIYGKTKYQGERAILNIDETNLVCRVNFVGPSPRNDSLFDYFFKKLQIKEEVPGFTNVFFTPLYVDDVVHRIIDLLKLNEKGIYHLVGDERISKFEFGKIIEKTFFSTSNLVQPVQYIQYPDEPRRGADLSLSNSKIKSLKLATPSIKLRLVDLLEQLKGD